MVSQQTSCGRYRTTGFIVVQTTKVLIKHSQQPDHTRSSSKRLIDFMGKKVPKANCPKNFSVDHETICVVFKQICKNVIVNCAIFATKFMK